MKHKMRMPTLEDSRNDDESKQDNDESNIADNGDEKIIKAQQQ